MSFLLVAGKIFICEECEDRIRVEYEGGASITQIGNDNIFYQFNCCFEKYGQPNQNPKKEGYYIYDNEKICHKCYTEKNLKAGQKIANAKQELISKYYEFGDAKCQVLNSLQSDYAGYVSNLISGFRFEDFETLMEKKFDRDLLDPHITREKRERKFKQYFAQNIRNKIDDYILIRLQADANFNSAIDSHNERVRGYYDDITALFSKDEVELMVPFDVCSPENLNNYIDTDNSARKSVECDPKILLYQKMEISLNFFREKAEIRINDIRQLRFNYDPEILKKRMIEVLCNE